MFLIIILKECSLTSKHLLLISRCKRHSVEGVRGSLIEVFDSRASETRIFFLNRLLSRETTSNN